MSKSNIQSLLKQELYEAIAYFIERQRLVAQAMLDLGLDLNEVDKYGAVAWASHKKTKDAEWDKLIEQNSQGRVREMVEVAKRAQTRQIAQKGIWQDDNGDEWTYFLHGRGCHLTHGQSQERINWNCPNVLSFDPHFFVEHLEWQASSMERGQNLQTIKAYLQEKGSGAIIKLIEAMIEEGLISVEMTLAKIRD